MENEEKILLESLAASGDDEALRRLCDYYFYETNKQKLTDKQFERLRNGYLKLVGTGDAHAMMVIGLMYYEGVNMPQDYTKARAWFTRAADAGDIWALNYLGYCHYYGREIPKDDAKAWYYFSKAASLGNHCGMYKIGDMYYSGRYVARDCDKAYYWYCKAIEQIDESCPEYPNIAARIGRCLLKGEGCKANALEALKWLHTAEEGCYYFLMKGDAFAHLAFPEIKDNIAKAKAKLDDAIADTKSVVQYT